MSEYTGEPSDLSVQQIPPAPVGNDVGKVARIRRVPGSVESPNGLSSVSRSSPRILPSVPPHFLDNTQAKSFVKLFLQILPLSTEHTLFLVNNFDSILQVPSFYHTLGTLDPKTPTFSHHFVRAEEAALGVSFNTQSQAPDIPGISSRTAFSFYTTSLLDQSKSPDIQILSYGRTFIFFQHPRSS